MAARSPVMSDQEDVHYSESFNAAIDEVVDWSQGNPDAEERRVVVSYPWVSRTV